MQRLYYSLPTILLFLLQPAFSQVNEDVFNTEADKSQQNTDLRNVEDAFRIMFYNVENLFDTRDDSLKNDEDFTPRGIKGWGSRKYYTKLQNIYRTIIGVGGWEPPAVIGLCEIENRFVLQELIVRTPLRKLDYDIIHEESPDRRGIDVAMLYRTSKFEPIGHKAITIKFPFDIDSKTRDILYVKGIVLGEDTVHLFVNHWPSRFGGHIETDPKRNFVASVLRQTVDSIYQTDSEANIVIMGDLNDSLNDESVLKILNAKKDTSNLASNDLFNLMAALEQAGKGTHKHENHWGILDQIIVSAPLLQRKKGLQIQNQAAMIYEGSFLVEPEDKKLGVRPFRTYYGAQYTGGYSDHLPVYLDLVY
ncbi:MAG: hypothetical protein R3E32_23205 [Chitinophagales bacterium]